MARYKTVITDAPNEPGVFIISKVADEKYRSRSFCAVLYPEDETHTAAIEKLKSSGYNYAAILHDEDIYEDGEHKGEKKKPHWHVVIKHPNAVWVTALAKDLGIAPNYLEKCKNLDSALLYLVHYGYEDTKFQYETEKVFGPLALRLVTLLQSNDEGTRALNLCSIIENSPGPIGYTELLKKAVAAGLYADLRRMGSFAVGVMREHNLDHWCASNSDESTKLDNERFRDFEKYIRGCG